MKNWYATGWRRPDWRAGAKQRYRERPIDSRAIPAACAGIALRCVAAVAEPGHRWWKPDAADALLLLHGYDFPCVQQTQSRKRMRCDGRVQSNTRDSWCKRTMHCDTSVRHVCRARGPGCEGAGQRAKARPY